jgi:hypothetical protein
MVLSLSTTGWRNRYPTNDCLVAGSTDLLGRGRALLVERMECEDEIKGGWGFVGGG